jgi:hypothetical protein
MAASSLTSQSIKDKRKNSWLRLHYHHTDHEGEKKKIIMFAVNCKDNFDCVNSPIHDMRLFLVQTNDEVFSKFIRK